MRILLSNDDGWQAPGIQALWDALGEDPAGHELWLVAPDGNRSGASSALTLSHSIGFQKKADRVYAVAGTPADCVHLALTALLPQPPELVISGINAGANLGDDVLYSGTVGAALEARRLAIPSLAVSLLGDGQQLPTAVTVVQDILATLPAEWPAGRVLNVNVPGLPYEQLAGIQPCRLGQRPAPRPAVLGQDPRGRDYFWVGDASEPQPPEPGTDFAAVQAGFVAMTPLSSDMSCQQGLREWLG